MHFKSKAIFKTAINLLEAAADCNFTICEFSAATHGADTSHFYHHRRHRLPRKINGAGVPAGCFYHTGTDPDNRKLDKDNSCGRTILDKILYPI